MRVLAPLIRRGTLADPQRIAVYRWENRWHDWNQHTTKLSLLRTLIRHACRLYSVPPPIVTWGAAREPYKPAIKSNSEFDPNTNVILLRKHQWNMAIALHEAAHAIVWHRFGQQRIDHGPTWLGIYLWLLVNNETAPRVALEASAREDGLHWTPIDESSPRRIRKIKVTPP